MTLDLGKYAGTVLGGYGVSLALLALLIAASVIKARRTRARLAALEEQRRR